MPMCFRSRGLVAAAAGLALACLASPAARAQVNYTEPPDLTSNLAIPSPVGTVAVGLNTVTGAVAATWNASGTLSGDTADSFSFIVPAGLAVSNIQLVITNFACNNCFDRYRSFSSGIGIDNIVGNTTFSLLTGGPLGPGSYNAQVFTSQDVNGIAGSSSFSYQFRITVVQATNDLCQFATPIGLGPTVFNNTGATTDGVAHAAACNFFNNPSIARDLWYTHVPAVSGILTVSTCGSSFDTEVNIYNGGTGICPGSDATLLACNDDNTACGAASTQSQLAVPVVAGQPYLIRVGGYDGLTTTFGAGTLTLSALTTGACCNRWTGHCTVREQLDCTSQGLRFDGFGAACSTTTCKACAADFDGSGTLAVQDIFNFLAAWFAGCP